MQLRSSSHTGHIPDWINTLRMSDGMNSLGHASDINVDSHITFILLLWKELIE